MLTSNDTEAEVMATIQTFMRLWEQRGVEAVDGFLAFVAEDFGGFGTGRGEYFPDRATLRDHTVREHEQVQHSITFASPWMKVRPLGATHALAEGEFKVDVQTQAENHTLGLRCSLLFERRQDHWVLIHFHISVPNVVQNEGDSLLELFKTRNRELEQEVQRRTAVLERSLADLKAAPARLVHQEKMASLVGLTAGIAHEIKNPLNFVNNFAALSRDLAQELVQELETQSDPGAVRTILSDLTRNTELIEEHGRRADSIVRSMLEHARSGSGERRAVDLNSLVSEHADLALHGKRAATAGFDATVTKDLDVAAGHIEVVPQEIGRVVLNLMGNAFDAISERAANGENGYQPTVAITTRRDDGQVRISVRDNGPGIPEIMQSRIFEPFFTTKSTGLGTGLGLSIAYDIITHGHGGSLTFESDVGRGATFTVLLPNGTN